MRPWLRGETPEGPMTFNLCRSDTNNFQSRPLIKRFWRGPKLPHLSKERIGNPRKGTGVGRDLSLYRTAGGKIKLCRWTGC